MTTPFFLFGRKYRFYTLIPLIVIAIAVVPKLNLQKNKPPVAVPVKEIKDSIIEIQISAVGDLMCHSTQYNYARVEGDSFNFVPCFDYVVNYLKAADFMIGNLETTLRGPSQPYSGYPFFNTPDDYPESIAKVGFDFLVTANNHANDTGEDGILRTISVLDKIGIAHTGSFASQRDRDSIRIVNVKEIKIAVIAYTYSTNGIDLTPGKPWLVNYCDSVLIKSDIEKSRKAGAEIVLVFYHFGEEYERLPNDYQKQFVAYAAECGADLIIGSHPHVLQPVDFFKTNHATLDTGFVAYSLGNFISNQGDEYTDEGVIMNIHLTKNINTNKIEISSVNYIPTWVYKGKNEMKKLHLVFPAEMVEDSTKALPEFLTPFFEEEMKKALKNTESTMTTYTNLVQPVNTNSF